MTNDGRTATVFHRTEPDLSPLEQFVATHPGSAWVPSLRAQLGKCYRERGRCTLALRHWEAAWQVTRQMDGDGKLVADFTLAHWVQLLASLGRTEMLRTLFSETEGRTMDGGPLQQTFNAAREGYESMLRSPGTSFMCGTYGMFHAAGALGWTNVTELLSVPSPVGGFTLAELSELSSRFKLGFSAVKRPAGTELIVPSVVHWRQDHYAAIVGRQGDAYRVMDPTFGRPRWMRADAINAEASGYFLVARNQAPRDWEAPTARELAQVHGQGAPNLIDDPDDQHACQRAGYNGEECTANCNGLARWWVSEPYLTLWLEDEPLGYQPSRGPRVALHLSYKERNDQPHSSFFNFGKKWECQWMSRLEVKSLQVYQNQNPPNPPTLSATYDASLCLAGGGVSHFENTNHLLSLTEFTNQPQHRINQTRLVPILNASPAVTGFDLIHPDGSHDVYQHQVSVPLSAAQHFLLTQKVDAQGRATLFNYGTSNSVLARLESVVDVDGKTNTLRYQNANVALVTEVEDPYGRKATLAYNAGGQLAGITDPAQLTSSFLYNAAGFVTTLTTPYGNTTFVATGSTNAFLGGVTVNRSMLVTDPNSGKHLYLYRDTTPPNLAPELVAEIPPLSPIGTLETTYLTNRNSWHWNPKQYAELHTTTIASFNAADYGLGRLRHWLHVPNVASNRVSGTLSVERAPSPDGTTAGQFTWYDYPGKGSSNAEGSSTLPGAIIQRLPDGDTHYVRYRRNVRGNPTNVVDRYSPGIGIADRTNRFIYADNGIDLAAHFGPGGELLAGYAYNSKHQVTFSTNAVGEVTQHQYNTLGQRQQTDHPGGRTVTYLYKSSGPYRNFLGRVLDSLGRDAVYDYTDGLVSGLLDSRGLQTTYGWDSLQRLIRIGFPDGTSLSNRYAKLDLVATRGRLTNDWTWFFYNPVRQLTILTNARNHRTQFDYCTCGVLDGTTDALNQDTVFLHDLNSRLTRTTYPDASFITNVFDRLGRLERKRDPAGNWTTNTYTVQGLLEGVDNTFGRVVSVKYDQRDRPIRVTDASGVTLTNFFDNLDRVVRRAWQDGSAEAFVYGVNGLIYHTNRLGYVTQYGRDSGGRLLAVTNANLEVTRHGYNAADDLVALVDGNGHTTTWYHDDHGRVISKQDALGYQAFAYGYNAGGRLTNRLDGLGRETRYAYDALGNLTNRFYVSLGVSNVFAYDALLRVTNILDQLGTNSFTYTPAGLLLTERGPWGTDTITLGYAGQLRTNLSLIAPNSPLWTNRYAYDAARRLKTVGSRAGTFQYQYGGDVLPPTAPAVTRLDLPGAASVQHAYDYLARLTNTALVHSNGTALGRHSHHFDRGGRITNQLSVGYGWIDQNNRRFIYDAIDQLTQHTSTADGGFVSPLEQLTWDYDNAGNLAARARNALQQTFAVDPLNQLATVARSGTLTVAGYTTTPAASVTVNGLPTVPYPLNAYVVEGVPLANGTNTFTALAITDYGRKATNVVTAFLPVTAVFTYDGAGNLRSDGRRTFEYDGEQQLTAVTVSNAVRSEFAFDALMRRRVRREFAWQTNQWVRTNEVRYVYDGALVLQERGTNNRPLITYTRGPDLGGSLDGAGGIGGLLGFTQHPATNTFAHASYHHDHGGNVIALLGTNQQLAAYYHYDPFGNLLFAGGPLAEANRLRFSGKEWHPESRLLLYERRAYEPNLQRWLTHDPLGEAGGINLYGFVGNDPVNWFDPDGLAPANVAVPPRVTPRNSPTYSINEEIMNSLRNNRSYRASPVEESYNRARRNAQDNHLHEKFPGHHPGNTYWTSAPEPPLKPPQCPPSSLSERNAPPNVSVSRNWGGESGPNGKSWTRDPFTRQSRDSLGLGGWNTGEYISTGEIMNPAGITTRPALPYGRYRGGGDEVIIQNPTSQIRLNSVVMPDDPIQ